MFESVRQAVQRGGFHMGREGEICRVVSLPHVKDVTINPDEFRMIREGRIVEVPHHTMNMEK